MTNQEAIEMLTAKAECIRREASGIDVDCNHRNCDECDLCYKQGTMGDQMEALGVAVSALQAQDLQPTCNQLATDCISRQAAIDRINKQREHLQPDVYPQDEIGDAAYRICAELIERLSSAQPEDCDTCKHGYFGDDQCERCRVRYPSHYERRTDEV